MLIASLRHNLARLFQFSGRESARLFWPYVGVLIALQMIAGPVILGPAIFGSMEKMQRFAVQHPDQATVTSGPGSYSITIHGNHPEFMPDVHRFFLATALGAAITVCLVAAAVARRLHDRGQTALWGLTPLPFLAFGLFGMLRLFPSFVSGAPDFRLFFLLFGNNILYIGLLIWLVIRLARDGTPGDNKYGPPFASATAK